MSIVFYIFLQKFLQKEKNCCINNYYNNFFLLYFYCLPYSPVVESLKKLTCGGKYVAKTKLNNKNPKITKDNTLDKVVVSSALQKN